MRNRAFLPLIEQILMIAVFAIVSAVCIGCFASARAISLGTEKKDTAVILAQNTAESIKTNGLSEKTVVFYNEDMTVGDSKDGFMVVCEPLDDSNALLGSASVSVFYDEKLLFEITVRWQEGL